MRFRKHCHQHHLPALDQSERASEIEFCRMCVSLLQRFLPLSFLVCPSMQSLSSRVKFRNTHKAVVRILDNGGGVRWVLKMGFERNNQKRWHAHYHHHHHHTRHHHVRVECVCLSACDSLLSLSSSSFFRVSRFSMI